MGTRFAKFHRGSQFQLAASFFDLGCAAAAMKSGATYPIPF